MAIKSLEQKKRQQTLLIIAIIIIIFAVVILYFGFIKKTSTPEVLTSEQETPEGNIKILNQEELEKIDIEAGSIFLQEKIFSFFKVYGDVPVKKGETGRNNPFVSY